MSERTPIKPEDIRKGDKIRVEGGDPAADEFTAMEYTASYDKHDLPYHWRTYDATGYYLLDRPEPPFEPKDGTIIVKDVVDQYYAAVRLQGEWMGNVPNTKLGWHGFDDWAKARIEEGWTILARPQGAE